MPVVSCKKWANAYIYGIAEDTLAAGMLAEAHLELKRASR
jgi:hypothetical protein